MSTDTAVLEAIIRSKADNTGFTESKAAAIGLNTELAGTPSFTAKVEAAFDRLQTKHASVAGAAYNNKVAHAGLNLIHDDGTTKARAFARELEHGTVVMGESTAVAGGLAQKIGALSNLGFTPATAKVLGLVGALGILYEAGKSAVEITEAHEKAELQLKQAADATGTSFSGVSSALDGFIKTNQRFIPDNQTAIKDYAILLRSTGDQKTAMDALNVVMNMSVLTGKDWDTTTNAVNLGLQGQGRGLRELGIDTKALATDQDILTNATKAQEKAQTEVETATKAHDAAARSLKEMLDGLADKNDKVRGSTSAYNTELARYEKALHSGSATTAELTRMQDALAKAGGHLTGTHQLTRLEQDKLEDAQKRVKDSAEKLDKAHQDLTNTSNTLKGAHSKQAEILDELNGKTRGGKEATSDLVQQQQLLKGNWDDMAQKAGPPLVGMLAAIAQGANWAFDQLDRAGNTQTFWHGLNDGLTSVAKTAQTVFGLIKGIDDAVHLRGITGNGRPTQNFNPNSAPVDNTPASGYSDGGGTDVMGFGAEGAIVTRKTASWVGDNGPEAVIPLSQMPGAYPLGGGIGGGTSVHIDLSGAVIANDQAMEDLAQAIGRRLADHASIHTAFPR